jgi:hypothetical protein
MAKERLSRLQKWILCRALQNEEKSPRGRPYIYRHEIYIDFFKCESKRHKYDRYPQKRTVTISRSLRRFEERGWIIYPHSGKEFFWLSVEGWKKAKSLMLTKDINNKKSK